MSDSTAWFKRRSPRHVLTEDIRLGDMKSSSDRTNCNFSRTRKQPIWCIIVHFSTYSWKRLVFLVSWSFLQRHLWLWRRKRWRRILDWPWEKWKSCKSLLWHDQSRWWVLVFYSYHWKDLHCSGGSTASDQAKRSMTGGPVIQTLR